MRGSFQVLAAALCVAASLGASRPRAADVAPPTPPAAQCPVPDDLAMRDISLPRTREAFAKTGRLSIVALGGMATSGKAAGDPNAAYPALLQADLSARLPAAKVGVVNASGPGEGASAALRALPGVLLQSDAKLAIWASGANEAARNADVGDYVAALQSGIETIRAAGADVIFIDLQYAPSIARIMDTGPYRDALYGVALENDVPVLRRYDLMMRWSDDAVMNFDAEDAGERQRVTRRLYACMAEMLASAIEGAVR